jgi:hypothetical protein
MLLVQPNALTLTLTIDYSDYSGATSKLPKILLNGNNICMVSVMLHDYYLLCPNNFAAHSWWHA